MSNSCKRDIKFWTARSGQNWFVHHFTTRTSNVLEQRALPKENISPTDRQILEALQFSIHSLLPKCLSEKFQLHHNTGHLKRAQRQNTVVLFANLWQTMLCCARFQIKAKCTWKDFIFFQKQTALNYNVKPKMWQLTSFWHLNHSSGKDAHRRWNSNSQWTTCQTFMYN